MKRCRLAVALSEWTAAIVFGTATNADWVYVRFLPTKEQIEAANQAGKKTFIAGPTVAGDLPENWQHCADVGLDAILTDYPLELRSSSKRE